MSELVSNIIGYVLIFIGGVIRVSVVGLFLYVTVNDAMNSFVINERGIMYCTNIEFLKS